MELMRIAACCLSCISLLVLIIALASDYWLVESSAHAGLWKACVSYGMNVVEPYIHATRAFLFMGMVAGVLSFFGLCASFFRTHIGPVSVKGLAVIASIVAGVFSMIAMSAFTGVYNQKFSPITTWLGWSFGIGWALFPLFLITGGLAYMTISITLES